MAEQYTCAACGETYDKGWSDEEAEGELAETFPGFDVEECSLVCDDCFQAMKPRTLSPIERQYLEIIQSTPEFKAFQQAFEEHILYGTPLPN